MTSEDDLTALRSQLRGCREENEKLKLANERLSQKLKSSQSFESDLREQVRKLSGKVAKLEGKSDFNLGLNDKGCQTNPVELNAEVEAERLEAIERDNETKCDFPLLFASILLLFFGSAFRVRLSTSVISPFASWLKGNLIG